MKTGSVLSEADIGQGDFEHWFGALLGTAITHETVDVTRAQPEPPTRYRGVVVTGSPAMVSDGADWSEAAAEWLRAAVSEKIPVLGVCFGHQLLAHALGGRVGDNPRGRQMGTQPVRLTAAAASDELFSQLPGCFPAQTSHQQAVLELPDDAVLLATSPRDALHAFRYGHRVWGIQFHPEFSAATTRSYIQARRDALRDSGQDPDLLLAGVEETPLAASLVTRFGTLTC